MLFGLAVTGLLTASCATDSYDDDERFSSGVRNQQLSSPADADITITPSADGKTQTISWPVVNGAGGYRVTLVNLEAPETPLVNDSVVDGCSLSAERQEDANYELTILTLGNQKNGNSAATTPTVKKFNTFAVPLAAIPAGDLAEWFRQNPVPDSTDAIYYDLEPGGSYTLNDTLDMAIHHVVLRATDKQHRAVVTVGENGYFCTQAPLTLQNINFDYSAIPDEAKNPAAIYLSPKPDERIKGTVNHGKYTSNYYNIALKPVYIVNCDFEGLKGMLLFDNNQQYCIENLLIENCNIHFVVPKSLSNLAFIYTQGGFVKDITIKNSSLWNTGAGNLQYVIRYNNSGRLDRAGYDRDSESQNIYLLNSTFYNVGSGWFCNWAGFSGQKYTHFDIEKNIFVDAGAGGSGVARRLLATRDASSYDVATFLYNTYFTGGAIEKEGAPTDDPDSPSQYDTSHTALQTDPGLSDPQGGNLTPTGAEQLQYQTGDPRWLP